MSIRHLAALTLLLATCEKALAAESLSTPSPSGSAASATPTFMLSGFTDPKAWRFMFGPEHSARQQVTMFRQGNNGDVAFKCTTDGLEEVAVEMVGVVGKVGDSIPVTWNIAGNSHPLAMTVVDNPKGRIESVLHAQGAAVVGLLATMANAPALAEMPLEVDANMRALKLDLPRNPNEPRVTSTMCAEWHNARLGIKDEHIIDVAPSGVHAPN